jgi:hypothetical protein
MLHDIRTKFQEYWYRCSSKVLKIIEAVILVLLMGGIYKLLCCGGLRRLEDELEANLRPKVSRPVCLGVRQPSVTRDKFFFLLEISFRHLRVSYFVGPSLTRGRVCNLL